MSIDNEALLFHKSGKRPGKISLKPSKPLLTQTDLSLAYTPGVAAPCREIFKNQEDIYEYTSKGNYVAVISNGTAVLGLGNIGPRAAKPVMEGKAVLFKKFADIDAIDLEVDTQDPEELVNIIQKIAIPWGGINLEDIKSPECFFVEQELQKRLDIPVFHDDQHGTAITAAAGLINAADLTGRDFQQMKIVINGPGAAGTACGRLLVTMGIDPANIIYCDRQGVLYKGRTSNMNSFKTLLAVDTTARTLQDALVGADVFLGLSAKDALTPEMLGAMAEKPIIFAMANPDPEIRPELARQARPDAIIATGRSDYPNQVNNVMCFPYVFRGALDVRATEINDAMKIAAVHALAAIAREAVPEEVMRAYSNFNMYYGPDYIIPSPFDPRLLPEVSAAVAKAAMDTGVAKKPLSNIEQYKNNLEQTNDSATTTLAALYASVQSKNKRVIFAEGEEASVIRAAIHLRDADSVVPILVADQKKLEAQARSMGIKSLKNIEIVNAATSLHNDLYIDYAYKQLNRKGFLLRDCVRAVKNKRNIFASCMLACGHGDAMITGLTRNFHRAAHEIFAVVAEPDELVFGMAINSFEDRTIFIADTAIIEQPTAEQLAEIAVQASIKVLQLGFTPRIAFIDSSNFGSHKSMDQQKIHDAMALLRDRQVNFEFDGEMSISVALNYDRMHSRYPFCNLTAAANVLILPNATAANALYLMLKETSSAKVIGPILTGTAHSIQILDADSQTSDIVNAAIWAAANTEA